MKSSNFYSKTFTLAPGQLTEQINVVGTSVLITTPSATGYTTDLALKIGDSGFRNIPTGTKITSQGYRPDSVADDVFTSLQVKNTGTSTITFHLIAVLGDVANYNLALVGAIDIKGAGLPVGRAAISAAVGGVTAAISVSAKAVTIQPETNGVIVEAGGFRLAKIGAGDFMTFPWSGVTLTLKGDGGTSTVYLAEVQ